MDRLPWILIVALLPSALCAGEIYQWRDGAGRLHFGDKPPAEAQTSILNPQTNIVTRPGALEPEPRIASAPGAGAAPPKPVVMYSTSWCGHCKRARAYFRTQGIPFTELDIERSAKGQRDYARLGGSGVPVILVGTRRLNGFDAAQFQQAYRAR